MKADGIINLPAFVTCDGAFCPSSREKDSYATPQKNCGESSKARSDEDEDGFDCDA